MGLSGLLRAAKKNDYTLLGSDLCKEIEQLKYFTSKIEDFERYIRQKRIQ